MKIIASLLISILGSSALLAQVTFRVNSLPANTPADASIYIAADFNDWDPGSPSYILSGTINGDPYITLPLSGNILFKFTRGTWQMVEGNASGQTIPNRSANVSPGDTIEINILSWEDLTGSTALSSVSVMSESFFMPELNRSRKIWICLPTDYATAVNKHYRVLYMHDGQNLFNDQLSFSGEWGIDEAMRDAMLAGDPGAIVIGIENGPQRLDEYAPWINDQYNEGGEGDAYVNFIRNTLKPYVDEHYRTLPGPENTGIAGSSLGGLISMYAAAKYPETFGKAGVLSPAFWFNDDDLYTWLADNPPAQQIRCYFVAGTTESSGMMPDINTVKNILLADEVADSNLLVVPRSDGQHSEWFWKREFPDAYNWLFPEYQDGPVRINNPPFLDVTTWPNPFSSTISLILRENQTFQLCITDLLGRKVYQQMSDGGAIAIDTSGLVAGYYFLNITDQSGRRSVVRLQKVG